MKKKMLLLIIMIIVTVSIYAAEESVGEGIIAANKTIVSIVGLIIGWAGTIALLGIFKNFIIAAFTSAFLELLKHGSEQTQRLLIKYFVDRGADTAEQAYEILKANFENKQEET